MSEWATKRATKLFAIAALILTLVASTTPSASAQVAGATLTGTVSDPSGAIVPDVKISVRNVDTGIVRETSTDASGFYSVPNLIPGRYEVSASASGFSTRVQSGVELAVGAQQVLNIAMQVGTVNESVQVTTEAPTVQLSSSALSGEVQATTVRELPLNGRDWTMLATLEPGVASISSLQQPASNNGSGRAYRGYGAALTISGALPSHNNYRVDGISVNDYDNSAPGNAIGASMGVDAIQEFSVVTSNYSAEYGRTSGGIVNAVTRSGTNQIHGSAYEFIRNSALDARNFFDGATIPPFRRNQFGASGGGPIKKDKSFFFVDYEGLRQFLGLSSIANVPSDPARLGNLAAGPVTVSGSVVPLLAMYPHVNDGLLGNGDTGKYLFVANQVTSGNFVSARFDHHISDKDSLFGTYQHDGSLLTLPDGLNNVQTQTTTANQHTAVEETHIFSPTLINTARFGYNRVNNLGGGGLVALNPAAGNPAFATVPGFDAPSTTVTGLTAFTGLTNSQTFLAIWNSYQAYDDANLTRGRHSIKFGFGFERDQEKQIPQINLGGSFSYGSLTAFLTNAAPTSFKVLLGTPLPLRYFGDNIIGAYVQDDIRWKPNFTINVGLRYEMMTVPTEKFNKLSNLLAPTDATIHTGQPFFSNPTLRDFAPRVGFAWDPFGNGKTSVRAGFGMFDIVPLPIEYHVPQPLSAPFSQWMVNNALPAGTYPSLALAPTLALNLPVATEMQTNPKRNYVMQWNLSLQREVMNGLTLTTTYIGSRGVHNLFFTYDRNMVLPTLTPDGYLWPKAGGSVVNSHFGQIYSENWGNDSYFDALEVQVIKKLSHGFQVQGSYTYGKSIDGSSAAGVANPYVNTIQNPYFFDINNNRAVSDYNVKHNLTIHSTWLAPKVDLANRAVNYALGGWELGGIFSARTGLPFTPVISGDPLGTKDVSPLDFPTRLRTGSGCDTAVNSGQVSYINLSCFTVPMQNGTSLTAANCAAFSVVPGSCKNLSGNSRRNDLIGPGMLDFDFSMIKNNYIGHAERFNAQFRAEFFNIFNRANFNPPTDNTSLFNANGAPVGGAGNITTTSTTSRQIQFALKLIW